MATNIASLAVSLVANTTDFNKKMKASTGVVTQFGLVSAATGIKVAKFVATITAIGTAAAGVAIGGLALLVRRSFETLDVLAKTSQKLGISTKDYGRLGLVASEAGVGMKQLEKALLNMIAKVQEASDGTGEAVEAMIKLGLNAKKVGGLLPIRQFFVVGDALRIMRSQAERVAVAYDVFGGRGTDVLRMLALSKTQLQEVAVAAEKLGLVFSEVSLQMVENANDSVGRVKLLFSGLGNALAVKFAPIVDDIATRLFNLGTEGEGIKGKVTSAFDAIIDKADSLILKLGDVQKTLKKVFAVVVKEAPSGLMDLIKDVFPEIAPLLFIFRREIAKLTKPGLIADTAPAKVVKLAVVATQIALAISDKFTKAPADRIGPIRRFVDAAEKAARAKAALQVAQQAAVGPGLAKLAETAKEEKAKRIKDARGAEAILELRGAVGQDKLGRTFFGSRGDQRQRTEERQVQLLEQIAANTRTPVAVAG